MACSDLTFSAPANVTPGDHTVQPGDVLNVPVSNGAAASVAIVIGLRGAIGSTHWIAGPGVNTTIPGFTTNGNVQLSLTSVNGNPNGTAITLTAAAVCTGGIPNNSPPGSFTVGP